MVRGNWVPGSGSKIGWLVNAVKKTNTDPTLSFYEALAPDYHLLFVDWPAAFREQAKTLNNLIRLEFGERSLAIYDCACGIGTQALGLAEIGHQVSAADVSPSAVARARSEAESLGVQVDFDVADMRDTARAPNGGSEVVLACDNAVPHLLTRDDVLSAAQNMFGWLRPGGMVLISTRDYDSLLETKPRSTPLRVIEDLAGSRVVFQVWEWEPNQDIYLVQQFILLRVEAGWQTRVYSTTYRAWRRAALQEIYSQAGFRDLSWRLPAETGFYQPVLTGRR